MLEKKLTLKSLRQVLYIEPIFLELTMSSAKSFTIVRSSTAASGKAVIMGESDDT